MHNDANTLVLYLDIYDIYVLIMLMYSTLFM